jgi:hypothetical protein
VRAQDAELSIEKYNESIFTNNAAISIRQPILNRSSSSIEPSHPSQFHPLPEHIQFS